MTFVWHYESINHIISRSSVSLRLEAWDAVTNVLIGFKSVLLMANDTFTSGDTNALTSTDVGELGSYTLVPGSGSPANISYDGVTMPSTLTVTYEYSRKTATLTLKAFSYETGSQIGAVEYTIAAAQRVNEDYDYSGDIVNLTALVPAEYTLLTQSSTLLYYIRENPADNVVHVYYTDGSGISIDPTWTLTFNANDGSNPPSPQIKSHGITVDLTGMSATPPAGKAFIGWSYGAADTNTISSVTMDGDKTVYAQYQSVGGIVIPSTPTPVTLSLEAQKTVSGEGAQLRAGQFDFAVYEGSALAAVGSNDANGKIVFTAIQYTQAGTYRYTMRETSKDGDGWTCDKTQYDFTVTVSNQGNTLSAAVSYPENRAPTFTNKYEEIIPPSEHHAYIIGYPDGTIRPNQNISRSETAAVLYRVLMSEDSGTLWNLTSLYSDVSNNAWYSTAVSAMSMSGTIIGYPDGTFRPDAPVSRGELATIVARLGLAQGMKTTYSPAFNDVAGHWAEQNISYASAIGWLEGYPDGSFRPEETATRAEFITLVNRILERVPESAADLLTDGMVTWKDNSDPNIWYYLAIQEATNSHMAAQKSKKVPGVNFYYEYWTELLPTPNWAQ
jgi:pilin isopeptide linkage protein